MQFPSATMTVHSSSERHARSRCGTFAQRVSSASQFALPFPWAHVTRAIRSPGILPHARGGPLGGGSEGGGVVGAEMAIGSGADGTAGAAEGEGSVGASGATAIALVAVVDGAFAGGAPSHERAIRAMATDP